MAFESLTSELTLDASDYTSGADDAASASEDLASSVDNTGDALLDLEPAGIAAGAGLAGVATAGQGLLDGTRDIREELNRTGQVVGMTQDEMVDLTTSITDATFSQEDAAGALGSLAEQGIETEEQLQDLALASDTLADATGVSATAVAEDLGPAMAAVGDDVEDMEGVQDAVAIAVNESTLEFDELTRQMERNSDELKELGLGTEETAGLMSAFAEETGLSGRELRREFDDALQEADGSMEAFTEETGLSEDVLADWKDELEEGDGAAEAYSESVSDNVSTMDELRSSFADAKLQASEYLGPLESLIPAAQAGGVAMMGMSMVNFGALAPSFAAVSAAALPITAVVLGLAAAVTAAAVIWKRDIGGIQGHAETARDVIVGAIGTIVDFVGEAFDTLSYILFEWSPADAVTGAVDDLMDALPSPSDAVAAAEGFIGGFADTITDLAGKPVEAVEDLAGDVRDRLPFSPAKEGPLSDLDEAGEAVGEEFGDNIAQSRGAVTSGADAMAGGAAGATAGGGGGTTNVEVRFTGGSGLEQALWDLLRENVEVLVDNRETQRYRDSQA